MKRVMMVVLLLLVAASAAAQTPERAFDVREFGFGEDTLVVPVDADGDPNTEEWLAARHDGFCVAGGPCAVLPGTAFYRVIAVHPYGVKMGEWFLPTRNGSVTLVRLAGADKLLVRDGDQVRVVSLNVPD